MQGSLLVTGPLAVMSGLAIGRPLMTCKRS